ALEREAAPALRALGEDIGQHLGLAGGFSFTDWGQAIEALLNLGNDQPKLVVIDEFPYLVNNVPELPSLIQRCFGPRSPARARSRTRLILCGSAISIMGKLLAGSAPLRGRASLDLIVHPFDFRQSADFWGLHKQPETAFLVHAILGGTPAYRDLLRGGLPSSSADFDDWVTKSILDPASPLFREGRYLLAEEPGLTDRALYHSILSAIVSGFTRPGQIAATLNRPQASLAHSLNVLEDIQLVRRSEDAIRQKRPTYQIAEPIIRFYFAVMRSHLTRLELGRGRQIWRTEARAPFSSQVLGPHFEELARLWVAAFASPKTVGGVVGEVGSTVLQAPASRTNWEIDVVALSVRGEEGRNSRRKILALGEAKWRKEPMKENQLERLLEVRQRLQQQGDIDSSTARIILFSSSGFTSGLLKRASDEVVLVDLQRLYFGD
ncbi:MAG: AAA family ATPase, partial [Candidatus Dormibacteraceae bacterium]